eukprot:382459_1
MATRCKPNYRVTKHVIHTHTHTANNKDKRKRISKTRRRLNTYYIEIRIIASIVVVMIIMSFTIIMNDAPHLSVGNYFGAVNDNYTSNHLSGFWKCFTNGIDHQLFDNGYQCSLHNTSLSLNHEIGRGGQGTVYAITIDGSPFVLKHSYAKDVCYHLQREWRVLHMMW